MELRATTLLLPVVVWLAYLTLITGGTVPNSNWQLVGMACQSLLLAFLTTYLGRVHRRLYEPALDDQSEGCNTATSLSPLLIVDGIQQLPCAILVICASTNRLIFANQSALQLFALGAMPQTQLAHRNANELIQFVGATDGGTSTSKNPVEQAVVRRERVVAQNMTIRMLNGETKKTSVTAVPLFDAGDHCTSVMALFQDLTEHHHQLKRIEEIAYLDPLTGLPNRLSILRRIQDAFDRCDTSRFALLFMDFDRFKLINDSLGHEVGDQLLVEIGDRIRHSIRTTDCNCVPARLGGDEFVVLLDGIQDSAISSQIADRLLQSLGEPYHLGGHSIASTASIGIVTSDQHVESATDMLRKADLAMYKSKIAGKARYSIFDDSMKRDVEQRLQLENELRAAIKYNEFDFDIQSVVELQTRSVVGGEALLRWQHPRLGRISASQFVEVASETGLIVPLGAKLIQKACQFAVSLGIDRSDWRLHVNISRLQVLLPSLLELLDRTVSDLGLSPGRLVLEIAESSLKDEPIKVIERIQALKQRGMKVCLDNFGSGASPLAFLKDAPIDFLKLDRSLVHAVETSPETCVLLEALVTIANTYRIEVIAEGVENESQNKRLAELGCRFGQGYLFQRPLTSDEYPKRKTSGLNLKFPWEAVHSYHA